MNDRPDLPLLETEYEGVDLGDTRREARLAKIAHDLGSEPAKSFPVLYEDSSASLAGLYRLCSNPRVRWSVIAEGHFEATAKRCADAGEVLCIHDSTSFDFGQDTEREGLGPLEGGGRGFFAHLSLMVSADAAHRPLGVMGLHLWTRQEIAKELRGKKHKDTRRESRPWEERESRRWKDQAGKTEGFAADRFRLIHVCDREADEYDFLAFLLDPRQPRRFVVRNRYDRCVEGDPRLKIREKLLTAETLYRLTVDVRARKPKKDVPPKERKTHPARASRTAHLDVCAIPLELVRPDHAPAGLPATLSLGAIWAHETDCPDGEEPIDWVLLTSEPIGTAEEVQQVIRHYQGRWRIEEYFKALKSGCAFEQRQLFTYKALTSVLAVFLAVAWRLLLLRTLSREEPDAPGTAVLSPRQLQVLRARLKKRPPPENASVREALLAVAALGGHLLFNGDPGWIILSRGYEKLLVLEAGWQAHVEAVANAKKCVQS
jgi:hypothetical protein